MSRLLIVAVIAIHTVAEQLAAQTRCCFDVIWEGDAVEGDAVLVAAENNTVVVASESHLAVVDVADPALPIITSHMPIDTPSDLATDGSLVAYVAEDRTIRLLDLSAPSMPPSIVEGENYGHFWQEYHAVDFANGYLYAVRDWGFSPVRRHACGLQPLESRVAGRTRCGFHRLCA